MRLTVQCGAVVILAELLEQVMEQRCILGGLELVHRSDRAVPVLLSQCAEERFGNEGHKMGKGTALWWRLEMAFACVRRRS